MYSYDASPARLTDDKLLAAAAFLAPYYPLSQEEEEATRTISEYSVAREMSLVADAPLEKLHQSLTRAADMWEDAYRHSRDERYERPPEARESYLSEELSYGIRSGDPRAVMLAVESALAEALRRAGPVGGGPPAVVIPSELVTASQEAAERTRRHLEPYLERVAPAKQVLTRYLYRIVAAEGITASKS